jgi:hypothetical protein
MKLLSSLLLLCLFASNEASVDANCNKMLFVDEFGGTTCGPCNSYPSGLTPVSRFAFRKVWFVFCDACGQLCTVAPDGVDPSKKTTCQADQSPPLNADAFHYAVDFASESSLIQQMVAAAPEQVALLATSRIENPNALEIDQSHRRMYTQYIPSEMLVKKILLGVSDEELALTPMEALPHGELLAIESWTKKLPGDRIAIEFRSTIVRADDLSPLRILRGSRLELVRSPLSQKALIPAMQVNYFRPVKFELSN